MEFDVTSREYDWKMSVKFLKFIFPSVFWVLEIIIICKILNKGTFTHWSKLWQQVDWKSVTNYIMIQFSIGKSGIEGAERRIFSVILCFADMINTEVNLILCL